MILSASDFVGNYKLISPTPSQIAEGERFFLEEILEDLSYIDLIYTELASPTPSYFVQVLRDGRKDALSIKSWLIPSVYAYLSNSSFQTNLSASTLNAKTKGAFRTLVSHVAIVSQVNLRFSQWAKFYYDRSRLLYRIELVSVSGMDGTYEVKSVSTANEMDFQFLEPNREITYNGQAHQILSVPSMNPYRIEVKGLTQPGEILVEFSFLNFLKPDFKFVLSVL